MRRRAALIVGVVILSLLTFWTSVAGDVVHFKDGRKVEGTVTATTDATLTVNTPTGSREYPLADVDYIERAVSESGETGSTAHPADAATTTGAPTPSSSVTPGTIQQGLCTGIIADLATAKESTRVLTGMGYVVGGALLGIAMYAIFDPYGFGWQAGMLTFGILAIPGAIALIVPTKTEREAARILDMSPPVRESECVISLEQIAEDAHTGRVIGGLAGIATGAVFVLLGWDITYGIASVAAGVAQLLIPTQEERAMASYERRAGLHTSQAGVAVPG